MTTQETQGTIESIGARLNRARLKKKVTIDQVYKDIKIHPKIISALEEDRYEEFLSPIYIKAFLKSYCRYLDIDASKLLSDYDKMDTPEPKVTLRVMPKETPRQPASNIEWNKYLDAARQWLLPIAAGVIVFFVAASLIMLAGRAIKKASTLKRPRPTAAVQQKEPFVTKPLLIPAGQPLTLIVKTRGDVWLEVKSDGKTVFKSVLKKGSAEAYKANDSFQLWTGKGEYLDLILNGNRLGSPGGGVIKKILLNREGLTVEKK
jgi:cytoskeletal protein RodZ